MRNVLRSRAGEPILANLIRTEGPLNELSDGTQFFTLYADDFIESILEGFKSDVDQFRVISTRYYILTVSFIAQIICHKSYTNLMRFKIKLALGSLRLMRYNH